MPPAIANSAAISVRCMKCNHRATIDAAALERLGLKPNAPIATFVKRLRCTKCGRGSVMAQRTRATTEPTRRRA
jgi:uncharacterized protein YlaI